MIGSNTKKWVFVLTIYCIISPPAVMKAILSKSDITSQFKRINNNSYKFYTAKLLV